MQQFLFSAGDTSKSIDVFLPNSSSTTGAGLTGLVFNSAGLKAYYRIAPTGTSTSITLATQTVGGAFSSGGFVETDATNQPGMYRLDIPNAVLASAGSATIYISGATNLAPVPIQLQLNAPVNVTSWLGTTVATPATAGIPDVNAKNWNNLATVALPLVPTVAGRTLDVSTGGEAGLDWANIGSSTTTVSLTGTTVGTVTTVTNQLTAAAIATGVWQDSTAGDFTVASSIGKSLYTGNVAPGAAGGHFIAGSNAATTISGLTTGALAATTITASGAVAFQSTFAVTTSTSLGALACSTLTASGAVSFQSTFATTGTTTFNAFTVSNALTVSGATTLTGAVTATNGSNNITGVTASITGAVNVTAINSVSTSSVTAVSANIGTTQPLNFTGTAGSALVKSDTVDIAGAAVSTSSAQIGVNVVNAGGTAWASGSLTSGVFAAGAINAAAIADAAIDRATFAADTGMQSIRSNTAQAGGSTTLTLDTSASAIDNFYNNCLCYLTGGTGVGQSRFVTGYVGSTKVATLNSAWKTTPDNTTTFAIMEFDAIPGATAPTAAQVATAVWQDSTGSDFTAANSVGKSLYNAFTSNTSVFTTASLVNAPTGGSAPTVSQIATAVWQDTTAGDFTVAGSIGKSLFTSGATPGTAGGHLIAGSNAATTFATLTSTGAFTINGTSNVAQTGDSFARIGSTGSGLTSLAPSATALSTAQWTNTLATNLGTTNTTVATNLDATVSSRAPSSTALSTAVWTAPPSGFLAATFPAGTITNNTTQPSWYTAPGTAPTVSQIATAVWQDTTAGDFTTAGSIGKSLFTGGATPGASGGLLIAGSNAALTLSSLTVSGATTFTGAVTATNGSNSITGVAATLAAASITDTAFATSGANRVADTVLRRSQVNVEGSTYGDTLTITSLYGFVQQAQESSTATTPGLLTVFKTDGTTVLGTRTITTNAAAEPVTGVS